jgi:hypothetical protein
MRLELLLLLVPSYSKGPSFDFLSSSSLIDESEARLGVLGVLG